MITRNELDIIWDALEGFREKCIPEGEVSNDYQWNDICGVMAKIENELEIWENICL